jgi:hypothetical protein
VGSGTARSLALAAAGLALAVLATPALFGWLAREFLTPPTLPFIEAVPGGFEQGWLESRWRGLLESPAARLSYRLERRAVHGPLLRVDEGIRLGWVRLEDRIDLGEAIEAASGPVAAGTTWVRLDGAWESSWAFGDSGAVRLQMAGTGPQAAGTASLRAQGLALPGLPVIPAGDLRLELGWRAGNRPGLRSLEASAEDLGVTLLKSPLRLRTLGLSAVGDARGGLWQGNLELDGELAGTQPAALRLRGQVLGPEPLALLTAWSRTPASSVVPGLDDLRVRVEGAQVSTRDGDLRVAGVLRNRSGRPSLDAFEFEGSLQVGVRLLRAELERLARQRLDLRARAREGRRPLLREALDEEAAAEVRRQLELMTSQGLLRLEDGRYTARVVWRGGRLMLNGRQLHLERIVRQ